MSISLIGRDSQLSQLDRAWRDAAVRGAVLSGPAGVGRSALLAQFAADAAAQGATVQKFAGTPALSGIEFGAVASLIPEPINELGQLAILQLAHRVIGERAQATDAVIAVDDAHLLDESSAALVHQLVTSGTVFVVLTIRRGSALPDPITSLILSDNVATTELVALSEIDTVAVIHAMVGGPVEHLAGVELVTLSGGNPQHLHWLINDALSLGTLQSVDGIWQQTGTLVGGEGVKRLFFQTLSSLSTDELRALELLAIAVSMPFPQLEGLVQLPVLHGLEEAGLIWIDPDRAPSTVFPSSALLAEVVRQRMSAARVRELGRELSLIAVSTGDPATSSVPARWQLETGEIADGDTWFRGAKRALTAGNYQLAERYSRAGLEISKSVHGRLLLGEALMGQGRAEEAKELLLGAQSAAADDDELARTTLARMRNLRYLAGGAQEAEDVGTKALGQLESENWKDEIAADIALHAGLDGDFTHAVRIGARVLQRNSASGRAVVGTLLVSTQGQVMLGQLDQALTAVEHGAALAAGLADEIPTATDLLEITRFQALLFQGRLLEADQASRKGFAGAARRRDSSVIGIWQACMATADLFRGNAASAANTYSGATGRLSVVDPLRALPVTQCWRALGEVQAGLVRGAQLTIDRVSPEYLPDEFRVVALRQRVQAWVQAQHGDSQGGATVARETGLRLADHTHVVWGCLALHDSVRFGQALHVVDDLEGLAKDVDGSLVFAMARHARTLADSDAAGLVEVSTTFEDMGAMLLAAEAAAQAATVYRDGGMQVAAGRASARASTLAALCHGADTPALRQRVRFLTMREEEIARLAARGLSSREISDDLIISRRTVDNHLASVYAKLGLHHREELAKLMVLS